MPGQTIYTITSRGLRGIIGQSECTLSHLYTSIWGYARLHGLKRPRGTFQTDQKLANIFGRDGVVHYEELPAMLSPLITLGRAAISPEDPTLSKPMPIFSELRRPKLYRPNENLRCVLASMRQKELCTFEEAVNGVKEYAANNNLILDVHPMFLVTDARLRPLFPMMSAVPLSMLGTFLWCALDASLLATTDFPGEYFGPQMMVLPNSALSSIVGFEKKDMQEILLEVAAYVIKESLLENGYVILDERLAGLEESWRSGERVRSMNLLKRVAWSTEESSNETETTEMPRNQRVFRETPVCKIFDR
ncbi:hypothetical protein FOL47_010762 [Perkinsus chesapeaki]|uniref:DM2 domain-containing protein n=1 Tax=Perkinsus chesapeaki TaxID=330153 RepID=A0A7J6L292_PERCH|nr:hypothetical protein FOL47_010762 [Perkinsus chesapeaki]